MVDAILHLSIWLAGVVVSWRVVVGTSLARGGQVGLHKHCVGSVRAGSPRGGAVLSCVYGVCMVCLWCVVCCGLVMYCLWCVYLFINACLCVC